MARSGARIGGFRVLSTGSIKHRAERLLKYLIDYITLEGADIAPTERLVLRHRALTLALVKRYLENGCRWLWWEAIC